MHHRKHGDAAESMSGKPPTPVRDPPGIKRISPEKKKHQQRMVLIRNNASNIHFSLNTVLFAILSLIVFIGFGGFVVTWMAMEVGTVHRIKVDEGNTGSILANLRSKNQYSGDRNDPPFQLVSEEAPECRKLDSPEDITLTLVTQVSHDRLWMMKHHCERYRNEESPPNAQHRMSIAVYSNATLDDIRKELREMGCGVDHKYGKPIRPGLNIHQENTKGTYASVEVSVLDAKTYGAWDNYPVNELRNLALSKVKTTHILYIDVDFWPSDNLYEMILGTDADNTDDQNPTTYPNNEEIRKYLFEDPKLALVIPAFQVWRQCKEWEDCRQDNLPKMEATRNFKGLLREVANVQDRSVTVFDPTNRGGHGSTDYKAWFSQAPGSLVDIECLQSNRYEPFLMVRYCRDLPPFQTAFAGYGKNKITWIMQLIASGYIFSQVGGTYLVHYPHLDSASRKSWNGKLTKTDSPMLKKDSKRGKVDQLFVEFREWLDKTLPSDLRRLELCDDAQNDDGKLWVETTKPEID